jgi:uncharacterized membrane protein
LRRSFCNRANKDQKHGLEKILPFGRLFYAIPMGVFGTDHLADAKNIARIVPSWMPLHIFWVYLVGIALIAAALSITSGARYSAAALPTPSQSEA